MTTETALRERTVPSSDPSKEPYRLVALPISGWVHADDRCAGFNYRGRCKHVEDAMTETAVSLRRETALVERETLLIEYNAADLSRGVAVEIAAKWAYDLGASGGRGVGVRGVEEGVRLLSSHGEIVRVESCELISHDDREALFRAIAVRYVINHETGQEIKLDQHIAGKRVSKWGIRREGGEFFVDAWFELGIVKASRNAALKLLPSNVKSAILKAGLDAIAEQKRLERGGAPRSDDGSREDAERIVIRGILAQMRDKVPEALREAGLVIGAQFAYACDPKTNALVLAKLKGADFEPVVRILQKHCPHPSILPLDGDDYIRLGQDTPDRFKCPACLSRWESHPQVEPEPDEPGSGLKQPKAKAAAVTVSAKLLRKWAEAQQSGDGKWLQGVVNTITTKHAWAIVDRAVDPLKAIETGLVKQADQQALLDYLLELLPEPPMPPEE